MAEEAVAPVEAAGTETAPAEAPAPLHPSADATPSTEAEAAAPAEAKPAEAAEPAVIDHAAFTMPEGIELDTAAAEAFAPVAQELGISQEQAQKLVDFYAGERAKMEKSSVDAWEKTQSDWQDAVKADPDIGGVNLEENLGTAKKALDKYGSDALNDAILATGMGNNLEFIRFAHSVGKAMSEDSIGVGAPAIRTETDKASILFPNQN